MAFANTAITDIIATTIESRSGELADNFTNNNAFLRRMRDRGNVRTVSGGSSILEEIAYTDPSFINANSYSGYETLNISPNSPISAAQFAFAQYYSSVSMSGLEMLQNSGKEQIIDLLEGRIKVSEGQLMNLMDDHLYRDGTGNSSKDLTGLAAAVPDDPTTGTYGGISRVTWNFWRSHKYSGLNDGGAAVSATNIQKYMTSLAIACVRGSDKPDVGIADTNYYSLYVQSLQAIQRVMDEREAGAGFQSVKFYGGGSSMDIVLGGGVNNAVDADGNVGGATANHLWMLNTRHIFLRPHVKRNFAPIGGDRQAVNQDATVKLYGWAGNLTFDGPQFCGVLIA